MRRRTARSGCRARGSSSFSCSRSWPRSSAATGGDGARRERGRLDGDVLELVRDDVGAAGEPLEPVRVVVGADDELRRPRPRRRRARDRGSGSSRPSGSPASPSMRPSCPPPMQATSVVTGGARGGSGLSSTLSVCASRNRARAGRRSPASAPARIAAASSAALTAPARPIASVADGDAGRHLHDREQRVEARRAPSTRPGRRARAAASSRRPCPGRCAAPPAPAMSTLEAALLGRAGVLEEQVGRAVRRDDAALVRHAELVERLRGVAHRLPVGARPHDEPTSGVATTAAYFARDFFTSAAATERAVLRTSRVDLVVVRRSPASSWIVPRSADPFRRQTIASRRTAAFGSRAASSCRSGPVRVDVAGMVARERLQRDQRRAARARALVLEPPPEQLELLPEAELRDRPVADAADAGSRSSAQRPRARRPTRAAGPRAPARSRGVRASSSARAAASASVTQTVESDRSAGPT